MKNIFNILGEDYVYNRTAALYIDIPLENQRLFEDIVQITHRDNSDLCIDIGWYGGDFDFTNGYFKIVVVKNSNWDEPLYSQETKSVPELEKYLKESLTYLD